MILIASHRPYDGRAQSRGLFREQGRVAGLRPQFRRGLASRGIRVNTISSGPVVTPIWTKMTGATGDKLQAMESQIASRVPLKRVERQEEIAAAALFLASDDAAYITGVDLPVDGGVTSLGFV